jgi:hypothetical protein
MLSESCLMCVSEFETMSGLLAVFAEFERVTLQVV